MKNTRCGQDVSEVGNSADGTDPKIFKIHACAAPRSIRLASGIARAGSRSRPHGGLDWPGATPVLH